MNNIKAYRKAGNLTQWDLAKLLKTSQARIWQWENGVSTLREWQKRKIAEVLKVNIEAVFPPGNPAI